MAITLRLIKGSELTFVEVDNNFKSVFYSSSLDGNELKLFYFPGNTSQSIDLSTLTTDTGSFLITGSIANGEITLTKGDSTTFNLIYNTGSFTGSFTGDGSGLTGVEPFPFTGSAQITGSLEVVGPTLIGSANTPSLTDTTQVTATGNGNIIYNVPTSSYEGAFFFYTAHSASNARAGTIVSTWIPGTSDVVFNETTTNDIGSTSVVNFTTILTGAHMALTASVGSGVWTIKTIIKSI
tara:strand:+ start:2337 stop:3050 length:714 start_codon:yes stop_codon:yes gene_type:complete